MQREDRFAAADAFLSRRAFSIQTALKRLCKLCSTFIQSEGGDCQAAVHGMIGPWWRSSRSLSNFLHTPLGWQFSYLDRPVDASGEFYFFGGSWLCRWRSSRRFCNPLC
jgi:hypothetical protein